MLTCLLAAMALNGCVPTEDPAPGRYEDDPPAVYLPTDVAACFQSVAEIPYQPDPLGADHWQSPAETLQRNAGDCEDLAILLQHMLRQRGYECDVAFGIKDPTRKHGHSWCEVRIDGVLYIAEAPSGALYVRSKLPAFLFKRVDGLDIVAEKVRAYHNRTGVWVNDRYRRYILQQPPQPNDQP